MPGGDHRKAKSSCEKSSLSFLGLAVCLVVNLAGCSPTDPRLADCYAVRMAILSNDIQLVRTQLDGTHRIDVNCRNTDKATTLLGYATTINSVEMARLLLGRGANPDHSDDGFTPLMAASAHGYSELAALLLEHGANVNAEEGTYGLNALALAVTRRHPDLVRLLLDHGANREHRLRDGSSIQQLALDRGGADVLRALNP
jgi:ankyrin repeat protein